MKYSELVELSKSKNILIKDLCSIVGYTRVGLQKALDGDTIELRKLKILCDTLRISPALFFDAGTYGAIHKPDTSDTEKMNAMRKEIDYLKSIIKDKDEIINLLREKDSGYRIASEGAAKYELEKKTK